MDEKDNNARPKRTRVLRAADVMPPFNKLPEGAGAKPSEREPLEQTAAPSEGDLAESDVAHEPDDDSASAPDVQQTLDAEETVPQYDLAENILAEQRRVASRRRRSPGQTQEELVVVPQSSGLQASLAELPSDDLPEIQRIVAEIVARDIDRLCRRPSR